MHDNAAPTMLSGGQLREIEGWLRSAKLWSEASQTMVSAATGLTNASRSLAAEFDRSSASPSSNGDDQAAQLATQLLVLAETIEDEGRELRDRYLTTESEIAVYAELLD